MSWDDIKQAVQLIEGWLPDNQGELLYRYAAEAKGDIVEIGSYRGRSTVCLAKAAQTRHARVYAIDPHDTYQDGETAKFGAFNIPHFYRALLANDVAQIVRTIHLPSTQVALSWDTPVGFLYVDGGHEYDQVKADYLAWREFVIRGKGLMAFHDSGWHGVKKLLGEMKATGWKEIERAGSLSVWKFEPDEAAKDIKRKTSTQTFVTQTSSDDPRWMGFLSDEQRKQIKFALNHYQNFAAGSISSNRIQTMAMLANMLTAMERGGMDGVRQLFERTTNGTD